MSKQCSEKEELVARLMEAHAWLVALTTRETDAAIQGDLEALAEVSRPLDEARIKRENALVALRYHVREHGC